jgi:hypothetical protein
MALIIKDHAKLHEAIGRAVLAGGAAALAGIFLPATFATAVTVLVVGIAVAPPKTWASAAWALLCACAGGAASRLGPGWSTLGLAGALGGTLTRGVDGWWKLGAFAAGALGAATTALIGKAFTTTGALAFLPSGIESLTVGALTGGVLGVSSIGRYLALEAPAIDAELTGLTGEGELGKLLGRAQTAYRDVVLALGDSAPQARTAADDLVKRMARFGRRWKEVEAEAARTQPDELGERLAALDLKLATATDPQTRGDFERAREAVAAQLAYLDEISRGRERAVARLTHQVATLERLRLAAVRHRSVDAARLGSELQPVVEEIADAGQDLDLAAEALTEAQTQAAQVEAALSKAPQVEALGPAPQVEPATQAPQVEEAAPTKQLPPGTN